MTSFNRILICWRSTSFGALFFILRWSAGTSTTTWFLFICSITLSLLYLEKQESTWYLMRYKSCSSIPPKMLSCSVFEYSSKFLLPLWVLASFLLPLPSLMFWQIINLSKFKFFDFTRSNREIKIPYSLSIRFH